MSWQTVRNLMERPVHPSAGFRPTDTVALSTVQRLALYQQARRYSFRINLLGFLLLAIGGVCAGLLLHGSATGAASRMALTVGALGLAGTGLSLLWARRANWSILAGVWSIACLAGLLGLLLGAAPK